jgi:hypothetical protein
MAFDNLLFDNLILHNCGVTIVDYNSVEKVDDNSCRFSFFHHYPVNGGILINYVERFLVTDMNAIKKALHLYMRSNRRKRNLKKAFLLMSK